MKNFIYVIVGMLFISKLSINSYYKIAGAESALESHKQEEIAAFYASLAYRQRLASDSTRVGFLRREFSQKEQRNARSLETKGVLVHTRSLSSIGDSVKVINQQTQAWAAEQERMIEEKYAKRAGIAFHWGGIGLIYVFELLALGFGFLAPTRQRSVIYRGFRVKPAFWVCVGASFYAEYVSCQITKDGLQLLLNNPELAKLYAQAFWILSPMIYVFSGLHDAPHVDQKSAKTPAPALAAAKKDDKILFPKEIEEAVQLYVAGELKASQRDIAQHYYNDKSRVSAVNALVKSHRNGSQNGSQNGKSGQMALLEG